MQNKMFFAALFSLLASAGTAQQKNPGNFKLSAAIAPDASGSAFLYYEKNGTITTDSAAVIKGKFMISGQVSGPVFARLAFIPSAGTLFRPTTLSFFLEPGTVNILSADTLKNVRITGSKTDVDFLPIRKDLMVYNSKLSLLNQQARQYLAVNDSSGIKAVRLKMDQLQEELKAGTYRKFAEKYLHSPVSLYAIDQVAGSYLNPWEIEPLFNALSKSIRDSKAGRDFAEKIRVAKASSHGGSMPDFAQPDTSGKLVKLSSFKSRYVLIDFWASWCMPCREENPDLVKAFHAFKDKGFTILSVSLDKSRENWLKAIRVDNLSWTQVSDLKYWNNEAAKKFDIRYIPQNILVDPSGKVIARNLKAGELGTFLSGILK